MKHLTHETIASRIYQVRSTRVMLDSDLAERYQTETKFINRAVKRNESRFPELFMFQLTEEEWKNLKYQFGTSSDKTQKLPNHGILLITPINLAYLWN